MPDAHGRKAAKPCLLTLGAAEESGQPGSSGIERVEPLWRQTDPEFLIIRRGILEAAGVETEISDFRNLLMARDFWANVLIRRWLPPLVVSPRVL